MDNTQRIRNANIVKTNQILKCAGLNAETGCLIIAAQDQSLTTINYQVTIIKMGQTQ